MVNKLRAFLLTTGPVLLPELCSGLAFALIISCILSFLFIFANYIYILQLLIIIGLQKCTHSTLHASFFSEAKVVPYDFFSFVSINAINAWNEFVVMTFSPVRPYTSPGSSVRSLCEAHSLPVPEPTQFREGKEIPIWQRYRDYWGSGHF